MNTQLATYLPLAPLALLVLGALLALLLVPSVRHGDPDRTMAWHAGMVNLSALVLSVTLWVRPVIGMEPVGATGAFRATYMGGALVVDSLSLLLVALASAGALLVLPGLMAAADRGSFAHGELHALLLFAVAGSGVVASAGDVFTGFLGLEIVALSVYGLVGLDRSRPGAHEAVLKYLLLGAFASAILLLGMAFLFGATGSLSLGRLQAAAVHLPPARHGLVMLGLAAMVAGLAFKVAAAPFHMWSADVYEGAVTPLTGFMATVVKVTAFVFGLRLLVAGLAGVGTDWQPLLAALAAASMVVGNLMAMNQRKPKRMMAFSSVVHTGYMLVGLAAAAGSTGTDAVQALVVYLVAYLLTNLAAFGCLDVLERNGGLDGAMQRNPGLATAFVVALLSLVGFPMTAGFLGKYMVFSVAFGAGLGWLGVLAILSSMVSLAYYMPLLFRVLSGALPSPAAPPSLATGERVALAVSSGLVLVLGAGILAVAGWMVPGAHWVAQWALQSGAVLLP
ncbi:MAG: NADH-quinone oxidoreductase subunit N [Candidatus Sericytochromatia bacterium]|nr:NADH-quinone oxidoreductase subunit N [Candidatus Tanganyikabacteria bacterium]